MFSMDAMPFRVVVVLLAVAGLVVPVIVGVVPRVEGFSEFLKNPLTGLTVQSVALLCVFNSYLRSMWSGFSPVSSKISREWWLATFQSLLAGPPVPVTRFLSLCVVEDFRLVGSVDFQHLERSLTSYSYFKLVNYPTLFAPMRSLRVGLPASKTRFADTGEVSVGSAVSTGVNESLCDSFAHQ